MRVALPLLLLIVPSVTLAQSQAEPPRFVERPGIVEFSGQLIVRPAQPAALAGRGVPAGELEAIRARAARRLRPYLLEYVPQTDEHVVTLPPGQDENGYARELLSTGDYEYVEPNWICHPTQTIPNDQSYSMQWHHPKVRSPLAWDTTTGDPSLVIAIVDGGVMLDHTDLAGVLVPGYNAADRVPQSAGGDVSDVDGHGTFVAGLAGAIGNNGIFVTGMGWSFAVMPVRYYNSPGGGYLNDILAGARWAAENGAQCVNVSQTGVEYNSVQTTGAYLKSLGSLLFWAAGNDGRDLSWFDWQDVIVVGSTDAADAKAGFSAFGRAVDVYSPGTDIISTGIPGGLAIGSGTSASTPIVAGICGLVWSHRPSFTPAQVEERLFAGCIDLGAPGNDDYWGWGRADSYSAVGGPDPTSYCTSSPNSVGPGAIITWSGSASLSADDLELIAFGCPPHQFGLFYYGGAPLSVPFGEGVRCVGSGGLGIYRFAPFQTDLFGGAFMTVDYNAPPAGSGWGELLAGDEWFFQWWYRDPQGGPSGFNLSDGLRVVFWP